MHLKDGRLARPQQRGAADFRNDTCCLAGFQFVQAAGILAVLVTEGKMIQKVFSGEDFPGGEHLRQARSNATDIHDWSVEAGHTSDAIAFPPLAD